MPEQHAATGIDETHDAGLRSWVASANQAGCDFPVQNLPHGVFRRGGRQEGWRGGVAIGDQVLDLAAALDAGAFSGPPATACGIDAHAASALALAAAAPLNGFMAAGQASWRAVRLALSRALRAGSPLEAALAPHLVPQAAVEMGLPATIGDYTDFYASVHHATTVGALFRPDAPLLPNYKWVPIGYHGRVSSIAVSGQRFPRPRGQLKGPADAAPRQAPSARLDYELEMGIFMGPGNASGDAIALDDARSRAFGMVLLNDWSARDIQAWEYQPLGPFLAKSFATTISPWVVTMEALAPYRVEWSRAAGDPQPLPYLDEGDARATAALDIALEACLETARMRERNQPPARLSVSSFKHAYWTVAQMIAHHSSNGCPLQPGDLFGTGTQSGPAHEEAGSLLELSLGGKQPIELPDGETRTFLEDGDAVVLRAHCERAGFARIGFGDCRGEVLPAR